MSTFQQNSWFMLGAAVVGIVSAAGMIIAEHYKQERRRHSMAQDLARLDRQLSGLKGQLELLQSQSKLDHKPKNNRRHARHTALSTTSEDYTSALDLDSSDLEFYDVSDEEEETSKASTITPLDTVLKEVDEKLDSEDKLQINSAFTLLDNLCFDYPECSDLLWRVGKAHYKICLDIEDIPKKLEHISKGLMACKQALSLKKDCAESNKWYAILIGTRSDHQPLKDKIKDSLEFKHHLSIAIELKPEDPSLHHLLGRYAMEIAGLKWYERKAVAALYGELPKCTYEGAIASLLEAEKGRDDFKENKLAIGKCYIALGDYREGVSWLEKADSIVLNSGDNLDAEVKSLLSKFNSYR